jgi:hypothetical protein
MKKNITRRLIPNPFDEAGFTPPGVSIHQAKKNLKAKLKKRGIHNHLSSQLKPDDEQD